MREILFRGKAINRNKGYHRTKYKNGDYIEAKVIGNIYDNPELLKGDVRE